MDFFSMAGDPETLLVEALGRENVFVEEPMKDHTTFKIGGPADILVTPETVDQARAVLRISKSTGYPLYVMGLGSNLLVCDRGLPGIVMKFAEKFGNIIVDGDKLICQAGASNEEIARVACEHGLAGYEFASGIPGTVGGAAIMNAGAYDGEFSHVAVSIECITPSGFVVSVKAENAKFGYRHSMMMDEGYIVVGATLQLTQDDPVAIQARMDDLHQRREDKQPLDMPSAGSTFKRPEGYYAGKLIQDAGLRGYSVGDAQVSTKHTGFVVNKGNATARQVLKLIEDVQQRVMDNEGVKLEPEVRMWGFDK